MTNCQQLLICAGASVQRKVFVYYLNEDIGQLITHTLTMNNSELCNICNHSTTWSFNINKETRALNFQ